MRVLRQRPIVLLRRSASRDRSGGLWALSLLTLSLMKVTLAAAPAGSRPPELIINREHPLIILYGPGTAELTVKCWQHLPADIKPYCVVTMDPAALDVAQRMESWRRMLDIVQPQRIPIAL